MESSGRKWEIWIDRGGTFTDLVARKPDNSIVTTKVLSENPEVYKDAAIFGIRSLMGLTRGMPPFFLVDSDLVGCKSLPKINCITGKKSQNWCLAYVSSSRVDSVFHF